jgi:SHS2 domain-containing protein
MTRGYRFFDHTADIGAEVRAATLRGLFGNAALALFELLCDARTVRPRRRRRIAVRGSSVEDLLVRWLNEIVFLHEMRGWVFVSCALRRVDAAACTAVGEVRGEPFDAARHRAGREVKAVTYHQIGLTRRRGMWRVRIVFDV